MINRVTMSETTPDAIAATPKRSAYPSDLSEEQWILIEPFVRVDETKLGPQEVLHSRREIVDAIVCRTRTGCQWRYLPHDLPDWQIVFHYFQLWTRNGTLKRLHDSLRAAVRAKVGKKAEPTAAILDSQSVKSAEEANERGYDAGKKVRGGSGTFSSIPSASSSSSVSPPPIFKIATRRCRSFRTQRPNFQRSS